MVEQESQGMVEYQPPQEWEQWVNWLAAGLHGRNRWRLSPILLGMLFASGKRTVNSWLRAVGIADDFTCYYYFLQPLGRKALDIALRLFVLLLARLPLGPPSAQTAFVPRCWPTSRRGFVHHCPSASCKDGRCGGERDWRFRPQPKRLGTTLRSRL